MADVVFLSSGTTGAPKEIVRTDASLEADARALVAAFPDFPDAATYRKLKFQRLVRPTDTVTLCVTRASASRFAFSLDVASGRAASGLVEGCRE